MHPSAACVPQEAPISILDDATNCIQFPYFLDMTPCHWVIGYRLFGINLDTRLHGAKYPIIFRPLDMRQLGFFETSNADYQVILRCKAQ
jgi:hypothetical protein